MRVESTIEVKGVTGRRRLPLLGQVVGPSSTAPPALDSSKSSFICRFFLLPLLRKGSSLSLQLLFVLRYEAFYAEDMIPFHKIPPFPCSVHPPFVFQRVALLRFARGFPVMVPSKLFSAYVVLLFGNGAVSSVRYCLPGGPPTRCNGPPQLPSSLPCVIKRYELDIFSEVARQNSPP